MYGLITEINIDGYHRIIGVCVLREDMTEKEYLMHTNCITDNLIENRNKMSTSDFNIELANVVTLGQYQLDILM